MGTKKTKEELQIELLKMVSRLNAKDKEKVIVFVRRLIEAEHNQSL